MFLPPKWSLVYNQRNESFLCLKNKSATHRKSSKENADSCSPGQARWLSRLSSEHVTCFENLWSQNVCFHISIISHVTRLLWFKRLDKHKIILHWSTGIGICTYEIKIGCFYSTSPACQTPSGTTSKLGRWQGCAPSPPSSSTSPAPPPATSCLPPPLNLVQGSQAFPRVSGLGISLFGPLDDA